MRPQVQVGLHLRCRSGSPFSSKSSQPCAIATGSLSTYTTREPWSILVRHLGHVPDRRDPGPDVHELAARLRQAVLTARRENAGFAYVMPYPTAVGRRAIQEEVVYPSRGQPGKVDDVARVRVRHRLGHENTPDSPRRATSQSAHRRPFGWNRRVWAAQVEHIDGAPQRRNDRAALAPRSRQRACPARPSTVTAERSAPNRPARGAAIGATRPRAGCQGGARPHVVMAERGLPRPQHDPAPSPPSRERPRGIIH